MGAKEKFYILNTLKKDFYDLPLRFDGHVKSVCKLNRYQFLIKTTKALYLLDMRKPKKPSLNLIVRYNMSYGCVDSLKIEIDEENLYIYTEYFI